MNMLYDSDSFVVVHMLPDPEQEAQLPAPSTKPGVPKDQATPQLVRHGFEIVDKRSGKQLYLDGSWAEIFQLQIQAWQRNTPTQEEVEDTLDGYTGLAQHPVVVH